MWAVTREEFAELLQAAARPLRLRPGLVRRDRLVLLTLALTGLRRSELTALNRADVVTDGEQPSMLIRRAKGRRLRRQPLPPALAEELRDWRAERGAGPGDPAFCGLAGGRLHAT